MDDGAAVHYWFKVQKWHVATDGSRAICGVNQPDESDMALSRPEVRKSVCKKCKRNLRSLNKAMSAFCC